MSINYFYDILPFEIQIYIYELSLHYLIYKNLLTYKNKEKLIINKIKQLYTGYDIYNNIIDKKYTSWSKYISCNSIINISIWNTNMYENYEIFDLFDPFVESVISYFDTYIKCKKSNVFNNYYIWLNFLRDIVYSINIYINWISCPPNIIEICSNNLNLTTNIIKN